jgi:hypothetical protein
MLVKAKVVAAANRQKTEETQTMHAPARVRGVMIRASIQRGSVWHRFRSSPMRNRAC